MSFLFVGKPGIFSLLQCAPAYNDWAITFLTMKVNNWI